MELITKWNLSNACSNDILKFAHKIRRDDKVLPTSVKQGRQLLDQIDVSHISFQKVPIMEYMKETYHLNYRPIFDAIKELLSNKEIFTNCIFEYTPLYYESQRIYHEQYNGEWWERAYKSIPIDAKVLSIILYSDATTCDLLGKVSEHPIYLTLGNIVSWRRNKPDAKVLLGYLPQLKSISQKNSNSFKLAKRVLYQYALDIITRPLLDHQKDGFDLQTDDNRLWCYPFLSAFLGDLPENASVTLTFNAFNCSHPCHQCLTEKDDLNNVKLNDDHIILRTPENMSNAVNDDCANQLSLHSMVNIFWKHP